MAKAAIAKTWSAWNPISNAPKDGTRVLVWRPDEDAEHTAHVGIDKWSGSSWYHSRRDQQPTHWMPLPSPPELQSEPVGGGND